MGTRYLSPFVKRRLAPLVLLVALVAAALSASGAGGETVTAPPPSAPVPTAPLPTAPEEFFGIAPQTALTTRDIEYMRSGGIGSIRIPVVWGNIQPTAKPRYNWESLDALMSLTARSGLRVLPFVYGSPSWLTAASTTLPINSARARTAWQTFLKALVNRYGPGGEFWRARSKSINYEPAIPKPVPVRSWQIWNEANFFYFALPASPTRYAKLLTISSQAIKSVRPGAKVILSGLFAKPTAHGAKGMPADKFLEILYRTPGIKSRFDGIALHPYAVDTETLEEYVESFDEIATENHDRPGLYITEMGWGSQNDFNQVAFEQGIRGQVKQLTGSYEYLLENRRRLNLKGVYWYSWKDNTEYGACNFCDSVGLFHAGAKFRPKPAWNAFVALSGGSARPQPGFAGG